MNLALNEFEGMLTILARLRTRPAWPHARRVSVGAILARSRRTLCAAFRAVGLAHTPGFASCHPIANRARRSALTACCALIRLLVERCSFLGLGYWDLPYTIVAITAAARVVVEGELAREPAGAALGGAAPPARGWEG